MGWLSRGADRNGGAGPSTTSAVGALPGGNENGSPESQGTVPPVAVEMLAPENVATEREPLTPSSPKQAAFFSRRQSRKHDQCQEGMPQGDDVSKSTLRPADVEETELEEGTIALPGNLSASFYETGVPQTPKDKAEFQEQSEIIFSVVGEFLGGQESEQQQADENADVNEDELAGKRQPVDAGPSGAPTCVEEAGMPVGIDEEEAEVVVEEQKQHDDIQRGYFGKRIVGLKNAFENQPHAWHRQEGNLKEHHHRLLPWYTMLPWMPCATWQLMRGGGLAVGLFFRLFECVIGLVSFFCIVYIVHLAQNYSTDNQPTSERNWVTRGSLGAHYQDSQPWAQGVLCFVMDVMLAVFLSAMYHWMIYDSHTRRRTTLLASDFAVKVTNIQTMSKKSVGEIRKDLARKFNTSEQNVTLALNVRRVIAMYRCLAKEKKNRRSIEQIKDQMRFELRTRSWHVRHIGVAYISFETEQEAHRCLAEFNPPRLVRVFRTVFCKASKNWYLGRWLKVRPAPEPDDVLWKNLEISRSRRISRLLLTTLVIAIVILLGFGVVIGLEFGKRGIRDTETYSALKWTLSVMTGLVVMSTNWIIKVIIRNMSALEYHSSAATLSASIMKKLFLSQLLNTILVTIIIVPINDWYKPGGAADSVFLVVLFNAFGPPILNVLRLDVIWRRVVWCLTKQTQDGVNASMIPAHFYLEERYVGMFRTFGLGLIYGPMLPLVYPLTVIGLHVYYIADKFQLMYICRKPPKVSHYVADAALKQLSLLFFIKVIMSCIFYFAQAAKDPGSDDGITNIVFVSCGALVCLVHLLFPDRALRSHDWSKAAHVQRRVAKRESAKRADHRLAQYRPPSIHPRIYEALQGYTEGTKPSRLRLNGDTGREKAEKRPPSLRGNKVIPSAPMQSQINWDVGPASSSTPPDALKNSAEASST